MNSTREDQAAPDRGRGHEHGFKASRLRQKALAIFTVVVISAVCFLVYISADVTVRRLVNEAQTALPEGDLRAVDLQAAATRFQRALEIRPSDAYLLDAADLLQQRVAEQVGRDIARSELDLADKILAAASESWSDIERFGDTGELRSALDSAWLQQQIREEVAGFVAAALEVLAGGVTDGERIDDIRAALQQLRQALDLDPDNDRARTLRDDARLDLMAAARRELKAGNQDRAEDLLEVAQDEWRDDDAIAELRDELRQLFDELSAASELRRLIDLGEQRLAADNLSTPTGDSAVDYFRRALALDSDNEQAAAGLSQLADRYALLGWDAVERGDIAESRRLLSKLTEVAPQHPEAGPLQARIEAAEETEQVEQEQQAAREEPSQAPPPGPVIADDEEGRLWSEVMSLCDETQLRRYINGYPAGRYIDEAWSRLSACRAGR